MSETWLGLVTSSLVVFALSFHCLSKSHGLRVKQKAFYVKPVDVEVAARVGLPRDSSHGVFLKWGADVQRAWMTAKTVASWG